MPSMNPYDIYEQDEGPSRMLDLGSLVTSPAALVADALSMMVVVPALLNPRRLGNLVRGHGPDAMSTFRNIRKSGNFKNYRDMASHMGPKNIGLTTSGSTYARDVQFSEGLAAKIGKGAATHMQAARGLMGLSRFMLGYFAIDMGVSAVKSAVDYIKDFERPSHQQSSRQLETGGLFVDTRGAQTQRMRAIQAIHNTQLSTRAALGNEAAFMHLER